MLTQAKRKIFKTNGNEFHLRLVEVKSGSELDKIRQELIEKGADFEKEDFLHLANRSFPSLVTKSGSHYGLVENISKALEILDDVKQPMTKDDWLYKFNLDNKIILH